MIAATPVMTRFLVSLGSNFTRSALSFVSGVLVARGLTPAGYGHLYFLTSSFNSFRALLDLGSASAFFTFISRDNPDQKIFTIYFAWLAAQCLLIVSGVLVILPDTVVEAVWLKHPRSLIVLAFAATFCQQQLWTTVIQMAEANRLTVKLQAFNVAIALTHLAAVAILWLTDLISVSAIFVLLVVEFTMAAIIAIKLLQLGVIIRQKSGGTTWSRRETLLAYWGYCRPMILLSIANFLYEFADRWILQRYGGPSQQGYFQIASQFAAVSLLATVSVVNILWKETAEAAARRDLERIRVLYGRVTKGLMLVGAMGAGVLVPWSQEIVVLFWGNSYLLAAPALAVMFLYPMHQSMGQVGSTVLLAGGHSGIYTALGIIFPLVNLPITYLVQAPAASNFIPGFELGAMGMAVKTVVLNIISVNIQAWLISRRYGWPMEWGYQIYSLLSMMALGYAAKTLTMAGMSIFDLTTVPRLWSMIIGGLVFAPAALTLIWTCPKLAGLDRSEIQQFWARIKPRQIMAGSQD